MNRHHHTTESATVLVATTADGVMVFDSAPSASNFGGIEPEELDAEEFYTELAGLLYDRVIFCYASAEDVELIDSEYGIHQIFFYFVQKNHLTRTKARCISIP